MQPQANLRSAILRARSWLLPNRAVASGRVSGQILVFAALLMPVLLGMVAIGVDVAYLFGERREAQNAADLAALSGAGLLPAHGVAKAAALVFAAANDPDDIETATAVAPYAGNARQIEVTVTRDSPTFFARVLGISTVNITARAVAENDPTGYALFATRSDCGSNNQEAIDVSGSVNSVIGKIHSNSGIRFGGSGNTVTEAVTANSGCTRQPGSGNTFQGGFSGTGQKPVPVPPGAYTHANYPSHFACDYTKSGDLDLSGNGIWWVGGSKSSGLLNDKIVCASGKINLPEQNVSGKITMISTGTAGIIELNGSNLNIEPATAGNSILAFATQSTSDTAISMNGSNQRWKGILYAPVGRTKLEGSNNTSTSGMVVSKQIYMAGSGINITRWDGGQGRARLIE